MGILLGFLPFLAFAALSLTLNATTALIAGAAVSAGLVVRNHMRGGSPKILEIGTFLLFAALAIYAAAAGRQLSIIGVRLCVDIGLLAIVVGSIAIRRPFTLQYAKEQVPPEHWASPAFRHTNDALSAGWAVAFLVMVIAESAMLARPDLPAALGSAVIVAALLGAAWFTKWRAARGKASHVRPASD